MNDKAPMKVGETWVETTTRGEMKHKVVDVKRSREGRWEVRFDTAGSLPIYWDAATLATQYRKVFPLSAGTW
jgi:hypothetical protein